jgi:biotin transport system substrate-specific component
MENNKINSEKSNKTNKDKIKSLTLCAMFVAIIAVLSQIAIPLPNFVPITLQTFAVALCGYLLGLKKGTVTTAVYILIGAVGVPVFSSFKGGFSVLVGYTGGFIYGFLPFVILCAICNKKKIGIAFGIVGLLLCHICGVLQYMALSSNPFWAAALLVSVPYLPKDVISIILAYFFATRLRKIKSLAQIL